MKTTLALLTTTVLSVAAAAFALEDKKPEPPRRGGMEAEGEKSEKKEAPKEKKGLALGDAAPATDVKMMGVDDKEITLASAKGEKGTLVIFSCNHCPYVVAWEERIAAIGNEYKRKGVGVVVVNSNDPTVAAGDDLASMKERARERGFQFPYVVDSTSNVARAFGATKTPEVFLFDADMKLVYHGAIDDNHKKADEVKEHWLKDALNALLEGKEIEKTESKALGCTIKFRPAEQ